MLLSVNMGVIKDIRKIISTSKDGSLFFNSSFQQFDDEYIRHVLSDLCEEGLITRISYGIYVKPMRTGLKYYQQATLP